MSNVAIVAVTEYPDGVMSTMVSELEKEAASAGHSVEKTFTVYDKVCGCGGHCGEDGCGHCEDGGCDDEDCLCKFARKAASADDLVFALPIDGSTRMKQVDRIIDKIVKKSQGTEKRVFLISCSPSFEADVFAILSERMSNVCSSMGWEYAGEALVEGIPDACSGGDPVSRKKARKMAGSL